MSEYGLRCKIDIMRAELVRVADWLDRTSEHYHRLASTAEAKGEAGKAAALALREDAEKFRATGVQILDAIRRANAVPVRDRNSRRPRATDVACPRCGAAVDRPCIRDDGTPFKAPVDSHRERREAARNAP